MQQELKIAIIQSNLVWENPIQNRINFSEKINGISQNIDLVILPEMFTTGFTMNAESIAETMNGETITWMKTIAVQKKNAIVGSLVIKEDNSFYNRLLFVHPNGSVEYYDKRHTFTLADENKVYSAGKELLIVDYKGWKICPLICYDLRFPVWSRNTHHYDILLYVANWPKRRINAWDTLLKARAIENMSYCIGVNRVGLDANSFEYSGHSTVYDTLGNRIDTIPFDKECVDTVTLNKTHITKNRNAFKFLNDGDDFEIH